MKYLLGIVLLLGGIKSFASEKPSGDGDAKRAALLAGIKAGTVQVQAIRVPAQAEKPEEERKGACSLAEEYIWARYKVEFPEKTTLLVRMSLFEILPRLLPKPLPRLSDKELDALAGQYAGKSYSKFSDFEAEKDKMKSKTSAFIIGAVALGYIKFAEGGQS